MSHNVPRKTSDPRLVEESCEEENSAGLLLNPLFTTSNHLKLLTKKQKRGPTCDARLMTTPYSNNVGVASFLPHVMHATIRLESQ